jgi:hypothetical protein
MSARYWTGTDSAMMGDAPSKRISHPTGWEVDVAADGVADVVADGVAVTSDGMADVAADEEDASVDVWLGPLGFLFFQMLEKGFMVTGKNPTIAVMVGRIRNAHWAPALVWRHPWDCTMLGQETRHRGPDSLQRKS